MQATIVKKNKFLPLLTDTLPYEVPIPFSNRGFYRTIKEIYDNYYNEQIKKIAKGEDVNICNDIFDFIKEKGFGNTILKERIISEGIEKFTIPYDYKINKNEYEKRDISLIHPFAQLKICDFYSNHESEILYNTTKSNVSLRYPFRISQKNLKELDLLIMNLMDEDASFTDTDINEVIKYTKDLKIENIPNTYFLYKKYPVLYKFYDSNEFLDLEQQYKYCFKFDIQKCFNSIYTHSISWAVKNKLYAKKHKDDEKSFENKIDKLMQYSNWSETNGIPIGSEFSRIFAEILLQEIDRKVERQLKKNKVCIRRYVDDYFIFVNDRNIGKDIIKLYEENLKEYKLFINKSKNEEFEKPFMTRISVAKQKTITILREYFNKNEIFLDRNIKSSKDTINRIRAVIYENKINMFDVSNILLSEIFKELLNLLNKDEIENIRIENIQKYLSEVLNLSFYIFNLSPKSNSTIGICKICVVILKFLEKIDNKDNIVDIIKEKISFMIVKFFENKTDINFSLLEYLDLVWILDVCKYKLPVDRLRKLVRESKGYFEFMTLLSYVKDNKEYDLIKKEILKNIEQKFKCNKKHIFINTETFLLFFDVIKCKWVDKKDKRKILEIVELKKNKEEIIGFIKSKDWFFTWENDKINLITLFEIKKARNSYI